MYRRYAGILAFTLATACQPAASPDADAARQAIETHNANLQRWYTAGHIDSVIGVFAEDVWQMPPNMPAIVGRDSLRAFWERATNWGQWEFTFTTDDVVVGGDLAVERGRYTLRFTPIEGAPMPAMDDHGNYVVMWRQQPDGGWQIVWDAPVSEVPPAAPPP